jgi:drug/metabolite transporter (DMT)-like permease
MTPEVWVLVLLAALGHALWNFAARKVSGDLAVLWLAKVAANFLLLPLAGLALWRGAPLSLSEPLIACVLATGLLHAAYFALLSWAYEQGEISLVYPVARGSGVALTGLLAWLVLSEAISWQGTSGIALIFSGILMLGSPALLGKGPAHGFKIALLVGLTIAGYSLVDKTGVGYVDPLLYMAAQWLLGTCLLAPFVLRRHGRVLAERARTRKGYIALIGFGSVATYFLILHAFTQGPVSYIVAARESSVVIGALLGFVFLKEPFAPWKIFAIAAMVAGLVFLKLG